MDIKHLVTTCDFLLRWFSFQKKISPHSYRLKRLQVSKKFGFFSSKINYMVLQTKRQCNNLKIQKSYTSSHFDEQEDQRWAWITKLLNMVSGFVKAACSDFLENNLMIPMRTSIQQVACMHEQKAHVWEIKPEVSKSTEMQLRGLKKSQIHQYDTQSSKYTCYKLHDLHSQKGTENIKQWALFDKTRKSMRGNSPNNQRHTETFSMLSIRW